MARHANPKKSSDEWRTPPELFDVLRNTMGIRFMVDAAATKNNALVERFIDIKRDALSIAPWAGKGQWAWLNPPFSKLSDFIEAVIYQYETHEVRTVMLCPGSRCEQPWFERILPYTSMVLFPQKRVAYNRPDGTRGPSPNFPSMVLVVDGFECFGVRGYTVVKTFRWKE